MKIEDSGNQAAKGDIVDTSSSRNRHQTCGQLKSKTTKDFDRRLIGDYVRGDNKIYDITGTPMLDNISEWRRQRRLLHAHIVLCGVSISTQVTFYLQIPRVSYDVDSRYV
jgi:hypothetical protein